ncbi:MAG: M23 family metallopeptidase [Deltaproteobacteria bacterium]|jgi:murein DD-endopeptidase MepM/ murein hydrolase activator NlpD|nr:M23 family metallopeptidase [Deltaproteobacteria bacterium]
MTNRLFEKLRLRWKAVLTLLIIIVPMAFGRKTLIPVVGATTKSWNEKTFWYEPWGISGVHKGIDIFADKGVTAQAPVSGLTIYAGEIALGGKVVLLLGGSWRLHYLAHLDRIDVSLFQTVIQGSPLGLVGDTGNAKGKPPHVHYSIVTLVPYPHLIDQSTQGWKKIAYLNPDEILRSSLD